jgi:hypothetical protein
MTNIEKILIESKIDLSYQEKLVEYVKNGSFVRFSEILSDSYDINFKKRLYHNIKYKLNLKEHYYIVNKSLGVPRYKMPQIRGENRNEFLSLLYKNGYKVEKKKIKLKDLKYTQKELNTFNIEKKILKLKSGDVTPLIISKDNYVLDGHHNFKAASIININATYPCFRVSLNIHELLKMACNFHKVEFEEFQ